MTPYTTSPSSLRGADVIGARAGSLAADTAAPPPRVVSRLGVPAVPLRTRRLLWFDAIAAASAGWLLLLSREWCAGAFGFPVELVVFIAAANLVYGSYSGTLATATALGLAPPRRALLLLIAANALWVPLCVVIATRAWERGTALGLSYVALEACFVGALALLEYHVFFRGSSATNT